MDVEACSVSPSSTSTTLVRILADKYQAADAEVAENLTVFLTGATGFLGAYLINEILGRAKPNFKLIAHVRGAKNFAAALERLQRSLRGNGVWKDEWRSRLSCVVGDLSQLQLGIGILTWNRLSKEVDVVIHIGASAH